MKTSETTFKQMLSVWAVPRSPYYMEQNPNADPFEFRVMTDRPYEKGCVKVWEVEKEITVPAGIDLTQKAIDTLEEAMEEERNSSRSRIDQIQQQINNLRLLEHRPSTPHEAQQEWDDDIPF